MTDSDNATLQFKEKTVLISGAGRGFGLAAAHSFYNLGANLVLTDYSEELTAKALAPFDAARAVAISGDIGSEETSQKCVALAISEFGGLDIAVNNAGIVHQQSRLADIDSKLAAQVIQVNLMGVFYAMKHQLPAMVQRHQDSGQQCAIVNLSSAAGIMGAPMLSVYAASKHGVVGMTKAAALEYARKGIRINAVCPSSAKTDMALNALKESRHGPEIAEQRLVANVPMQRLGEVDEIVQAILWAASPQNSFFTGQTIAVDGGLSAI